MLLSVIFNCYKCHYTAVCHVLIVMMSGIMLLSVIFYCHYEGHCADECHFLLS
jgi:hypothetical protein